MIENGQQTWPIYPTCFHELGHNTDENNREGIKLKEKLQDSTLLGSRYYEWANSIFEIASSREKFYKNDNTMQVSPLGYTPLLPLGSMLSSALGLPEIEFARIKDKGKDYESQYFEKMFSSSNKEKSIHCLESLNKIKKIFDEYELDSGYSLSKRRTNQNLLNEIYKECIDLMQTRIEIELEHGNTVDLEEYKKHQMYFLKKINYNYRDANKSNGLRFFKKPIVHDIGFCTDNLSKKDLLKISNEQLSMVDFGFDNNTLDNYSKSMTTSRRNRNSFFNRLRAPYIEHSKKINDKRHEIDDIPKEESIIEK